MNSISTQIHGTRYPGSFTPLFPLIILASICYFNSSDFASLFYFNCSDFASLFTLTAVILLLYFTWTAVILLLYFTSTAVILLLYFTSTAVILLLYFTSTAVILSSCIFKFKSIIFLMVNILRRTSPISTRHKQEVGSANLSYRFLILTNIQTVSKQEGRVR